MPPLSNFGRKRDSPAVSASIRTASPVPIECRTVRAGEAENALRLLLAGTDSRASDEQLQGFLAVAKQRGLDLNTLWIAAQRNCPLWAFLPVVSPGRTMLLLSPPRLPPSPPGEAMASLLNTICAAYRVQGVDLAQMLLDPDETSLLHFYAQLGFVELAQLIYLQRPVRRFSALAPMDRNLQVVTYSSQTHRLFVQAISASYEDSLDCPALNGLRSMEDVLAGHQASGEFDPALWFLLMENDRPCGVLLLSRTVTSAALELVYLGLAREARGRGFGDVLMNLALLSVSRQNRSELTLAVDSRNAPALKLYHRHGLKRIGSRAALIRDLRTDPPDPQPIAQHVAQP